MDSVMIKSSPNGLTITLDENVSFDTLKRDVVDKFKENESFFAKSRFAIAFKGKKLTEEQQREIVGLLTQETSVKIICIVTDDPNSDQLFCDAISQYEKEQANNTGKFYKGTLRSGQVLDVESSVVILGDVNPGAKVLAKGNIVILGALRGTAYAGTSGNEESFVAAMYMDPIQIKIGDVIGRKSDGMMMYRKIDKNTVQPTIATVEAGVIVMSEITKGILNSL